MRCIYADHRCLVFVLAIFNAQCSAPCSNVINFAVVTDIRAWNSRSSHCAARSGCGTAATRWRSSIEITRMRPAEHIVLCVCKRNRECNCVCVHVCAKLLLTHRNTNTCAFRDRVVSEFVYLFFVASTYTLWCVCTLNVIPPYYTHAPIHLCCVIMYVLCLSGILDFHMIVTIRCTRDRALFVQILSTHTHTTTTTYRNRNRCAN